MLCHMVLVRTDVSEEPGASFIRVTRIGELGTTQAATSNWCTLQRFLQEPHGVTSQKTAFFCIPLIAHSKISLNSDFITYTKTEKIQSFIISALNFRELRVFSTVFKCIQDVRFSQQRVWRMLSSGIWRHVAPVTTNVLEEHITSSQCASVCQLLLMLVLAHWFFSPWWRRWYIPRNVIS
jgi:hypothetical protein